MTTDPIADLLTRLRNASKAGHESTVVPASRLKREVLRVLVEKGRIDGFDEAVSQGVAPLFTVRLKPHVGLQLRRISKPGQRIYRKAKDFRPVLRGYGLSIVSTSLGIMTSDEAKQKGIGGEVLCEVL